MAKTLEREGLLVVEAVSMNSVRGLLFEEIQITNASPYMSRQNKTTTILFVDQFGTVKRKRQPL